MDQKTKQNNDNICMYDLSPFHHSKNLFHFFLSPTYCSWTNKSFFQIPSYLYSPKYLVRGLLFFLTSIFFVRIPKPSFLPRLKSPRYRKVGVSYLQSCPSKKPSLKFPWYEVFNFLRSSCPNPYGLPFFREPWYLDSEV